MASIRFGSPRYARDLTEFVEWAKLAEEVGLDVLGYGDSSALWIDPFVALNVAANCTNRIRLVTTVTNPVTRHPSVMASGFAGLQASSGGRAVMGIGAGDSALLNLGLKPPPVQFLEDYVRCVQDLLRGRETTYQGNRLQLQWPVHEVPIWIAANGTKMLRLAGRIADGVIAHLGIDELAIEESLRQIHEGAREAGRDPKDIEIWWMVQPLICTSERAGWKQMRFVLAGVANHVFRSTFEGKAVPQEMQEALLNLQKEYRSDLHADPRYADGHNAELVDKYDLLEFLGRRFTVCGSPDQISERFEELAELGATNFLLIQVVEDRIAALKEMGEQVFSRLQS